MWTDQKLNHVRMHACMLSACRPVPVLRVPPFANPAILPAAAGAQEFMQEHEKAMEHNDKVLSADEGEDGNNADAETAPAGEGASADAEEAPAKKDEADALAEQVGYQL